MGRLLAAAILVAVVASPAVDARSVQEQPDAPEPVAPGQGAAPEPYEPDDEALAIVERTLERAAPSPLAPDDPFEAPEEAREVLEQRGLELIAAEEAVGTATGEAAAALEVAAHAAEQESAATRRRDRRRRALEREEGTLSDLVVRAYVTGGDYEMLATQAILEGDTTDGAGGTELLFEQVVTHQVAVVAAAVKALRSSEQDVASKKAARESAEDVAEEAIGVLETRTAARDAAATARDEAARLVMEAEAALRSAPRGGEVPLDVPLIGMPRLTGADLASWYRSSPYPTPRISTSIEQMADWFIEEGAREGIRGDIAFAQAVLETGGFNNTDSYRANNYSGIGHCDSCPAGWTFPSPQMGVRAQIQLLKSYAVTRPEYTVPLVDRRLRGPAGCCPTWGRLTTVWATDPGYGPKVMSIYSSIVDHALARRAAGESTEHAVAPAP